MVTPKYENAFNCKNCPGTGDETGCPMWWEFVAVSVETGKEIINKQCGYVAMPTFLTEVIKASNRPAASIDKTCNNITEALAEIRTLDARRYALMQKIVGHPAVANTIGVSAPLDAIEGR